MNGMSNFRPISSRKSLIIYLDSEGIGTEGLSNFNLAELSSILYYLQYLLIKEQLVRDGIEGKIDVQIK